MTIASAIAALVTSFNSYGTAVKSKISSAKAAGDNAQTTASAAGNTASSALTAANNAQLAVDTANTTIGNVQTTANTAKAIAESNTVSINTLNAHVAKFDANQIWTKSQAGAITPLTDAANISIDMSLSNNFSVTLAGNRVLNAPTNLEGGQSGLIKVTQDATGGRTLAFNAVYKFAGGTAPVLSTGANAVDYLAYYIDANTSIIYISAVKDVK